MATKIDILNARDGVGTWVMVDGKVVKASEATKVEGTVESKPWDLIHGKKGLKQ
mgnify:CR=1 FL=1